MFASATLAAGACAHKQKHDPIDERDMGREDRDRHAGGGGCFTDQARIAELEKQKADAKTEDEKAAIDQQLQQARQPVCMPYGAPPSRRRVV